MERLTLLNLLNFGILHQTRLEILIKWILVTFLIFTCDVCLGQPNVTLVTGPIDTSLISINNLIETPSEDFVTSLLIGTTNWLSEPESNTMLPTTALVTALNEYDDLSTLLVTRVPDLCCPLDYNNIGGECFQFVRNSLNFEEASYYCTRTNEGSLAKIDPIHPITSYLVDYIGYIGAEYVWIGLEEHDISGNRTFRWTFDDTLLNISNWADGEPSFPRINQCVVLSINGSWLLQSCNATNIPYVCQSAKVYCGELTTMPEDTTEEYTTGEITEKSIRARTIKSTTSPTKISTTKTSTTRTTTLATNTPIKVNSTIVVDEGETDAAEFTTEMVTHDEETVATTTHKITYKSTQPSTSTVIAPSTSHVATMASTSTQQSKSTVIAPSTSPVATMASTSTKQSKSTDRAPSTSYVSTMASTYTSSNLSNIKPTSSGSTMRSQQVTTPGSKTSTYKPASTTSSTGLARINKILISLIVIIMVLVIGVLCIIVYLIYKRKKSKQKTYNVEEGMELEDIKSIEDIAGPSTSTDGGVVATSFIADDVPEFSGSIFSGLRGKRYSYDIT